MGLFDKRQKMSLNDASGIVFLSSLTFKGRIHNTDLEGVDPNHKLIVSTGYIFGLAVMTLGSQIKANNINTFIDCAVKNAQLTMNKDLVQYVPEFEKYMRKATNWTINESTKYGSAIFQEYAKSYLEDLFMNNDYPTNLVSVATQDMLFYYEQLSKLASGIKIV